MNKLTDRNRLSIVNPSLAKDWHYAKNGGLTPKDVCGNSKFFVWWKCSVCSYEWKAKIVDRNYGYKKCPYHNSFAYNYPELLKEWNYKKNGKLNPYLIISGSPKKVWWICKNKHEWMASIRDRSRGHKQCLKCKSLLFTHPNLAQEWNYFRNGNLKPDSISYGSRNKKVWWKCQKCQYEWKATVYSRSIGHNDCLRCRSLGSTNPRLSKEWHPIKNRKLTPFDVLPGSGKIVWWKCNVCGYEWKARIHSRNHGHNCPNHIKIILQNGICCDSYVEAYYYLKYKNEGVSFVHHKKYGKELGKCVCDFYIKSQNKWIEVTSYHKGFKNYFSYLRNIVRKRDYVEKKLGDKFEFIPKQLTRKQKRYVVDNMKVIIKGKYENKKEK